MGGEHRPQLGRVDGGDNLIVGVTHLAQPADHLAEAVGAGGALLGEVVDAVHLLGGVGQVEVNGEGPGQQAGFGHVHIGQQFGQRRAVLVAAAQASGQTSHLLHPFEQPGTVLADQRVAKLGADTADVAAQDGVELFERSIEPRLPLIFAALTGRSGPGLPLIFAALTGRSGPGLPLILAALTGLPAPRLGLLPGVHGVPRRPRGSGAAAGRRA